MKFKILTGFIFILLFTSCGDKKRSAAGAGAFGRMKATVSAVKVSPASYQITEHFPATLRAKSIVQLRSDVTGYLKAILVPDGAYVKKGQPLYVIDKSRYQAAYNQAKAALQQSQADLAQKKRDLERYQDLLEHDAISRQTVDQAATAVKTSEANLAAAQAALDKAATDLNHATINAPISGELGIVQVKIGDIINAGQTLINTIVDDNPMYVDFVVPQSQISQFTKEGSSEKEYLLQLGDSSLYPEKGKLLTINNVVDPTTGTMQVRLQFPNEKQVLRSGMNATVLVNHPANNALAIPTKAITRTLTETSVYTVDRHNVVQLKRVKPGEQLDSLTIIQKGLTPGDRIVVNGLQKIRPGDTVKVEMAGEAADSNSRQVQ